MVLILSRVAIPDLDLQAAREFGLATCLGDVNKHFRHVFISFYEVRDQVHSGSVSVPFLIFLCQV